MKMFILGMAYFICSLLSISLLVIICLYVKERITKRILKKYYFVRDIDNLNLPIIALKVNNKTAYFMIDTGASGNIINKEELDFFDNKVIEEQSLQPVISQKGFEDASTYLVPFKIEEKTYLCRFVCSEKAQQLINGINLHTENKIHGILGIPFLKDFNALIDLKNNTITLK